MGGVPELMIVLMYVLVIALLATVGYLVVKKAVKKAIIEAHDEIEARGKQGQGSHGLCDCGREHSPMCPDPCAASRRRPRRHAGRCRQPADDVRHAFLSIEQICSIGGNHGRVP